MAPKTAPAARPPNSPPGTATSTSWSSGNDTAQAPTRIPKTRTQRRTGTAPLNAAAAARAGGVKRILEWRHGFVFHLSKFATDASELPMQVPDRIEARTDQRSPAPFRRCLGHYREARRVTKRCATARRLCNMHAFATLPASVRARRAAPTAGLSVENQASQASQCGTSLFQEATLAA